MHSYKCHVIYWLVSQACNPAPCLGDLMGFNNILAGSLKGCGYLWVRVPSLWWLSKGESYHWWLPFYGSTVSGPNDSISCTWILDMKVIWLVVDLPLWKIWVSNSWDDDIPNTWKNKFMFQTTNQLQYPYGYESHMISRYMISKYMICRYMISKYIFNQPETMPFGSIWRWFPLLTIISIVTS